ncbi:hypothetical protein Godav_027405 [Gossypium davidsonii]|uniref:RNase H type-1 domain-containing protein n=1 Tax=Gossypium davidsonii TaxID=34287 RepID=A0A7J8RVZ2_GOSDV|nr:hypothetical protein [Gossypium davidsonii]
MGFNQLADKDKEVLVIAYWAIWHAWNRLVHDGIKLNIQELVVFIKGYLIEIEALEGLRPSSFVPKQEIWVPPDTNNIKLNYDASFNTNTKIPILDAFIAEAHVCEQTMTFAQELGFRSIHVEGDSLTVMKKSNNIDSDRSVLGLIIQDIKGKVRGFDSVTFGFVGRSANTTAHVLARSGCRLPAPQYWIEEAPLEYLSLQKVPKARFSCVSSLIFHAGPRWGRVYKKIVQILASFVTYS